MPALKRAGRRLRKSVKKAVKTINKGAKKARKNKLGKRVGTVLSKSEGGKKVVRKAMKTAKRGKAVRAMIKG